MNFIETLTKLQAERGESNYRLAKEIDVTQTSIKNWKSGIKPHPRHAQRLEKHFQLEDGALLKLLKGEKDENSR